jgi:hypothetical protein
MHSDFLDASNPDRLRAFFKYVDAANLASQGIKELHIDSPRIAILNARRSRAQQAAIDLFNGSPYVMKSVASP